tara:strand:+ start:1764 stop:1886 length:123 start_codon:yes stop_codon:yes gene_type:complete
MDERIQFIKMQLANSGHLDGWVIKGYEKELEKLIKFKSKK